jgi:hypothetical protein
VSGNSQQKRGSVGGCVLVAVGAWVAWAPFLIGGWAWDWHSARVLLTAAPGAIVAIGGLIMLSGRPRQVSIGGALSLIGGLWFAAGPLAYAVLVGPEIGAAPSGESVGVFQWVFFFLGAGAFISLVSAYALGLLVPLEFGEELSPQPPRAAAHPPVVSGRLPRRRGVSERPAPRRVPFGSYQSGGTAKAPRRG